jgi:acetyl/propionyl-CoA carboxylase alpha subunit
MRGHAIEARICAENPDAGFLPATGTLQVLRWPAHVSLRAQRHLPRVDTGVRRGRRHQPALRLDDRQADRLGRDRAQALARLDAALRDTHIVGLHTNVAFLRRVVGSHAFATADLDTALIERERAALFEPPPLAPSWPPPAVVATAWPPRPRWKAPTPGRAATAGGCTAARAAALTWPAGPAAGGAVAAPARRRHHAAASAASVGACRRTHWATDRHDAAAGQPQTALTVLPTRTARTLRCSRAGQRHWSPRWTRDRPRRRTCR